MRSRSSIGWRGIRVTGNRDGIRMQRLIVPLTAAEAVDADRFGPKAANLARLGRAGLPIPDGFCVDSEAYRVQVAVLGLTETAHASNSADPEAATPPPPATHNGLSLPAY